MSHWLLVGVIAVVVFLLQELWGGFVERKLYKEGRDLASLQRAARYRMRALYLFFAGGAAAVGTNLFGSSPWVEGGTLLLFALGFVQLVEATRRTSRTRISLAVVSLVCGAAIIVVAVRPLVGSTEWERGAFGFQPLALIILGSLLLLGAIWLARPH